MSVLPPCLSRAGKHAWAYGLAVGIGLFGWSPAHGAAYEIDLEAGREIRELLTEYLDLYRYRDREDVGPEQLEFLVESTPAEVERLLATEGYFSTQTEVKLVRQGKLPLIRLEVKAGPRTTVRDVDIKVTGAAIERSPEQVARIRNEWPLTVGEPFRQEEWTEAKQLGLQILQQRRYAAASLVDSQARILADQSAAELGVHYASGPVFTFGPLQIEGTQRYPERIIRNVNPLRTGEEYSAERLLELQRQIQKTGYFSNVVVDLERDPAKADKAPVTVDVNEFPTQRVRANMGYTTDTGFHVDGLYTHLNTFGRAWIFNTQASIEQERQSGTVELAMPPSDGAWVNSVHGTIERTTLEGIDLRTRRIGIRHARSLEKRDSAYFLTYYNDRLEQTDSAPLPEDTFVEPGVHQALVLGLEKTLRYVDDPIYPRKGTIVSFEVGGALRGVLSDATFLRAYSRLRQFIPIGERDLMILRGELGGVFSEGRNADIPASLLFRAGGTGSVRGYEFQSIGNRRGDTVFPTRYLATGGVEYVHWIKEDWGAAVFYDVGLATDRWADKSLFHAVGVGARWRSPVGRVNLDLAYGFQANRLRPHLSLGIAF